MSGLHGNRIEDYKTLAASQTTDRERVGVWLERIRRAQSMLRLDHGTGVAAGMEDRIFEPFASDKPEGTGLGLAIVKRILKDHRGDIELADTSNEGTAFHFWIPLQD